MIPGSRAGIAWGDSMARSAIKACFLNAEALKYGLSWEMVWYGVEYVYNTMDRLDATLIEADSPRIAELVELANLSSMLGNLLATGIVKASGGVFTRNPTLDPFKNSCQTNRFFQASTSPRLGRASPCPAGYTVDYK